MGKDSPCEGSGSTERLIGGLPEEGAEVSEAPTKTVTNAGVPSFVPHHSPSTLILEASDRVTLPLSVSVPLTLQRHLAGTHKAGP